MAGPAHAARDAGPLFLGVLQTPIPSALNHLLRGASWARERLRPHAGKVVRAISGPVVASLEILANGEVALAEAQAIPAATITLSPAAAVRGLADRSAWHSALVEGDAGLAQDILYLTQNLRWDAEEDLSRVVGDIAAHRILEAGMRFRQWQRQSAEHFAQSAARYWTDEQPLLPARNEVERFNADVDDLRDTVERIEKRIARL